MRILTWTGWLAGWLVDMNNMALRVQQSKCANTQAHWRKPTDGMDGGWEAETDIIHKMMMM